MKCLALHKTCSRGNPTHTVHPSWEKRYTNLMRAVLGGAGAAHEVFSRNDAKMSQREAGGSS